MGCNQSSAGVIAASSLLKSLMMSAGSCVHDQQNSQCTMTVRDDMGYALLPVATGMCLAS